MIWDEINRLRQNQDLMLETSKMRRNKLPQTESMILCRIKANWENGS